MREIYLENVANSNNNKNTCCSSIKHLLLVKYSLEFFENIIIKFCSCLPLPRWQVALMFLCLFRAPLVYSPPMLALPFSASYGVRFGAWRIALIITYTVENLNSSVPFSLLENEKNLSGTA